MWFGKLAVVMFIFSFATLFSTYYLNQVFNDPGINQSTTYKSLHDLVGSFNPNISPNSTLIFGDFISAFNLLTNLMSGGVFGEVFGGSGVMVSSGFFDSSLQLLMALMFDSSCLFFILYIISNRSI